VLDQIVAGQTIIDIDVDLVDEAEGFFDFAGVVIGVRYGLEDLLCSSDSILNFG